MSIVVNGPQLRERRLRAGLTQREVADRLGVRKQRVQAVEASVRVSDDFAARYLSAIWDPARASERFNRAVDELIAAAEALTP